MDSTPCSCAHSLAASRRASITASPGPVCKAMSMGERPWVFSAVGAALCSSSALTTSTSPDSTASWSHSGGAPFSRSTTAALWFRWRTASSRGGTTLKSAGLKRPPRLEFPSSQFSASSARKLLRVRLRPSRRSCFEEPECSMPCSAWPEAASSSMRTSCAEASPCAARARWCSEQQRAGLPCRASLLACLLGGSSCKVMAQLRQVQPRSSQGSICARQRMRSSAASKFFSLQACIKGVHPLELRGFTFAPPLSNAEITSALPGSARPLPTVGRLQSPWRSAKYSMPASVSLLKGTFAETPAAKSSSTRRRCRPSALRRSASDVSPASGRGIRVDRGSERHQPLLASWRSPLNEALLLARRAWPRFACGASLQPSARPCPSRLATRRRAR
mmetsp:Transcript_92133/g.286745  ORF Transcript_92133/g.286745 Transcript_92133/m.286745 type:complete len:390 (-) Transcript_92133:204-1373(-)